MVFQQILLPLFGIIVTTYVFIKLKRNQFSIELSFFWMFVGATIFILSVFPSLLNIFSSWVGIYYPPTVLFLITSILLLFVIFRQERIQSRLNEHLKDMAQYSALLEGRVIELERQFPGEHDLT
jgi:hypothetical protein